MPFRQSLLNFYRSRVENVVPKAVDTPATRPELQRTVSSSSSDTDPDTIRAVRHPPRQQPARQQLPTPSESSMDVSIMDAQMVTMKHVPKGRARRVTPRLTKDDGLVARVETESLKSRTISGETLVNIDNASQSTLVKEGIAALDLPWNMSQVFSKEGKTDLLDRSHNKSTDTVPYTKTAEEEEEDRLREEKAAAKRAKMAENNKIWEERRKAAEKQASRRSSRVPILDKAGDLVTNIANSVLGKRKERAPEPRTSPRKSLGTFPSAFPSEPVLPEPSLKKRRVTQGDAPLFAEPIQPKAPGRRGEKKWLSAGLYVGQLRPLTGNKNRRKSAAALEEVRENKVLPLPMYAGERLLTQGRDFKLPFDVFCPLPNGQPKPDEWKKVNKNVFVGDAAQSWRVSKYEEHSSCVCKPETGCDQDCMNRYMFYECDDRNCNLTAEQCGNRPFEALRQRVKKGGKYNVGVEVIKTEDRGYGVRSNRTFEPNQLIVEYTGEIITQEECERRMKTIYKTNECYYLMLFDQNMIIDATRGSIARFVNHSCEPNCRMEKWTVNGKPRMALFAGDRGVMTGDELSYDYNFDPYSQKNVQECRCGAEKCRGVLGPRPKEERKQRSPDEEPKKGGKMAGAKRKIAEAIGEGTNRLSKKAKVVSEKAKVYKKTTTVRRPSNSPIKVRKMKLMKQAVTSRKSTGATALGGLTRRPSKLKQIVATVQGKTAKQRVVSSSSSTALIAKDSPAKPAKTVSRSSSMREKASSVKSRVVKGVRGSQSGKNRSIRLVGEE